MRFTGSGSARTKPTTNSASSSRRIVIFASEDVGLADPEALPLAIATQQAVEFVGLPEARIPLAHATDYMCRAKKSREAYEALGAATEEIESEQTERVPERLKNKHFPGESGKLSFNSTAQTSAPLQLYFRISTFRLAE